MIEWYNYFIGLDLESGEYQFDLYGLKRIEPLKRENKNFGFLFALRKVENATNVCSTYQGRHPILYYGNTMEAKRMKAFAKLAKLEFIGNV